MLRRGFRLSKAGRIRAGLLLAHLLFHACRSLAGSACEIKADEEIVFFPAMVYRAADGTNWESLVRGCVYEREQRPAALAAVMGALKLKGVTVTPEQRATLRDRARLFMVDNEGGKRIVVGVGGRAFDLGKSARDGTFAATLCFSAAEVERWGRNVLEFQAMLAPADRRVFRGTMFLVKATGLTVISDVDDTIKITSVRDRRAMLRNSFLEPFRPVPGMANAYSNGNAFAQAQFCYLSASPWQLYIPLSEFVLSNGFPAGIFELKHVWWTDKSLLGLFEDPGLYKTRLISPVLERFPGRQFVLVGDSGEQDPETYASLARRYPAQVVRILIRDVTDEPGDSSRYQEAFRDLPPGLWRVFRDPSSLGGAWQP